MIPPRPPLPKEDELRLSHNFGQYVIRLSSAHCGDSREAHPATLAKICGWDALLKTVLKKLRCSR